MAINQKDIKLLWGLAACRCAFPDCRALLTQTHDINKNYCSIGEQAHIIAREKNGPRGDSLLSDLERDSYENLILLCPNHHTIIDKEPTKFTVDKLKTIKKNHELWVQNSLSSPQDLNQLSQELIYAELVDAAIKYCHLNEWDKWTFGTLEPVPVWPHSLPQDIFYFRQKIFKTDFPGTLVEFEKSIQTLSLLLDKSAALFREHCDLKEDSNGNLYYQGDRFYRIQEWDQNKYYSLLHKFDDWVQQCHQLILDSTKAANWFRDVVRRDINPMFFATEKFTVIYPWSESFSHKHLLLEYEHAEKNCLPECLL